MSEKSIDSDSLIISHGYENTFKNQKTEVDSYFGIGKRNPHI